MRFSITLIGNLPFKVLLLICIFLYEIKHVSVRLINNKGQYWYGLRDDFNSLGDAYDDL
jgi:hypothetical protein